jgi:TonB family protein
MKRLKHSGALIKRNIIFVLPVFFIVMALPLSCRHHKNGEVTLTKLSPPPLPPPPLTPPSMTGSDTTWDIAGQMPMFPGGEELLMKYISLNTKYPEAAKIKGISGKVIVKFRITSRGNVNGYQITQSVSPELDAEALRVIRTITKFEPAIVEGKPVSAWYYLPITFTLK